MSSRQSPSQGTALAPPGSPALLAAVVEAASDPTFVVAGDGRIVLAGGALERWFGYGRDELVGRPLELLVPEALRGADRRPRRLPVRDRGRRAARRRDGTEFPIEVSLSRVQCEQGRFTVATVHEPAKRRASAPTPAEGGAGQGTELRATAEELRRSQDELARQAELLAGVFDHAPIGEALIAPDGRWLRVNQALCEIVGYEEHELLEMAFRDLTHPDHLESDRDLARRLLHGEVGPYTIETRFCHKSGRSVWVKVSASLVRAEDGTPRHYIAQIEDFTERMEIRRQMLDRERLLADAQALAHVGSWERDATGRRANWSAELCRIFGQPVGFSPTREEFLSLVHPADRSRVAAESAADAPATPTESVYRIVRPDGEVREVRARRFAVSAGQRDIPRMFGTIQDVTEQAAAERELRRSREHAEAIVAAMHEGYGLTVEGRIVMVNDALCRLTGFCREELIGSVPPYPFWPPESIEAGHAGVARVRRENGGTLELMLMRKDETRFMAEITAYPARNPDGTRIGFVNTFRDISERKSYEAELERLASEDALTGLANRRVFEGRLAAETSRALRHGRPLSVAVLDLDHFKDINDRHGHVVGDRVLQEVAGRLGSLVREGELLARVGGEEFAWILPDADAGGAFAAAERARDAIRETPLTGVGTLTLSAGICELAATGDAAALFGCADQALYEAKRSGRDRTVRYG